LKNESFFSAPQLKRDPLGSTSTHMLTPSGYWIAIGILAAFCATVALIASRSGTPRDLGLGWLVMVAVLGGLGYLDWSAQTHEDTSLTTYILIALLVPLGALSVSWFTKRGVPVLRWFVAAIVAFILVVGVTAAAYITGF